MKILTTPVQPAHLRGDDQPRKRPYLPGLQSNVSIWHIPLWFNIRDGGKRYVRKILMTSFFSEISFTTSSSPAFKPALFSARIFLDSASTSKIAFLSLCMAGIGAKRAKSCLNHDGPRYLTYLKKNWSSDRSAMDGLQEYYRLKIKWKWDQAERYPHHHLYRVCERIGSGIPKRIHRDTETSLTNELEGRSREPCHDINGCNLISDFGFNAVTHLQKVGW